MTITVTPLGEDDEATTDANTPVIIPVLDNDPSKPSVEITETTDPPNGTVVINPDGTVTYTPDDGFAGVDTFTYTACVPKADPELCFTQTVTVLVKPVGVDDMVTTPTNTPKVIDVLDNDDTDGLAVTEVSDPPHGSVVINPDGTVTYTPDPGFSGNDTFTYTACAEVNALLRIRALVIPETQCITKTVQVVVTPTGVDDTAITPAATPVNIPVLVNDPAGPSLTVKSTTTPSHGTVVIKLDGTITYTPAVGFSGIDTFTYTACDADNQCITQTVTVTVQPVGRNDETVAEPGKPVVIIVLGNDPAAPSLTVVSVSPPGHGTAVLNADGTITYTPEPGFTGTDTFTYTACDAAGQCITQVVTIKVQELPDTGANTGVLVGFGALLLGAGGLLVGGSRRRRRRVVA